MKTIKSIISNFFLAFLLLFLYSYGFCINAQEESTEPTIDKPPMEAVNSDEKKPVVSREESTLKTPRKSSKKPIKKSQNSKLQSANTDTSEATKTKSDAQSKEKATSDSESNKGTVPNPNPLSESEESAKLNLPEVTDKEIEQSSSIIKIPEKPQSKNIIYTIISWILIFIGCFIILKVIISNFRIPRNFEPHVKNKHGVKSYKRKLKYNFKYK